MRNAWSRSSFSVIWKIFEIRQRAKLSFRCRLSRRLSPASRVRTCESSFPMLSLRRFLSMEIAIKYPSFSLCEVIVTTLLRSAVSGAHKRLLRLTAASKRTEMWHLIPVQAMQHGFWWGCKVRLFCFRWYYPLSVRILYLHSPFYRSYNGLPNFE